jgi:hypothetical protein
MDLNIGSHLTIGSGLSTGKYGVTLFDAYSRRNIFLFTLMRACVRQMRFFKRDKINNFIFVDLESFAGPA